MAGFGPSKTIVIKDIYLVKLNMLKEGGNKTEILANNTTTDDEILAVLGHGSVHLLWELFSKIQYQMYERWIYDDDTG